MVGCIYSSALVPLRVCRLAQGRVLTDKDRRKKSPIGTGLSGALHAPPYVKSRRLHWEGLSRGLFHGHVLFDAPLNLAGARLTPKVRWWPALPGVLQAWPLVPEQPRESPAKSNE